MGSQKRIPTGGECVMHLGLEIIAGNVLLFFRLLHWFREVLALGRYQDPQNGRQIKSGG